MSQISRRSFLKSIGTLGAVGVAGAVTAPFLTPDAGLVFDDNNSYWNQEAIPACEPLSEDLSCDVAIIGAGFTGLYAALHLKRHEPHLNIVLLEANQPGYGASGRNGGMLLPQFGAESFDIPEDLSTHQAIYNMTVASMKELGEWVKRHQVDCDWQMKGYLHTYFDSEDTEYYQDYLKNAQSVGMPIQWLDTKKIEDLLGTDVFEGAMFDPNGGSVHPIKLIKALVADLKNSGVRIFGDSQVTQVDEGSTIRLRVSSIRTKQQLTHVVQAAKIVVASSAYTTHLGLFKNRIFPVHAQTAVTRKLTDQELDDMGWESRLPFYDSRNALFHVVLTPDNRIVIGGGSVEYFFRNNLSYKGDLAKIHQLTLQELHRLYPSLAHIKQFDFLWNGLLDMSYDETAACGVTGKHQNIYYALGYSGQGVALSHMFGAVISALHRQVDHPWLATPYGQRELPWVPPEPFRWLGVNAAIKYYQREDEEQIS